MAWTGGRSRSPKEILHTLSSSPLLRFVRVESEHVETARWEQDRATEMERGETTGTRQDKTIGMGQEETTRMGRDETSGTGRDGVGQDVDHGVRQDDEKRFEKKDPICESKGPAI